jgi:hypothetical protein
MPLQKLQFRPGLNREGTDYSNEGGWYDGDKIRFRSGFPEKIGGWTRLSNDQYLGVARSLWNWATVSGSNLLGVGTSKKYYIEQGGTYNDVTPFSTIQTTLGAAPGPFTATNGSATITVTDASYNPSVGDYVVFSGAVTLGGNITAAVLNQEYVVATVPSSTTFTIQAKNPTTGLPVLANTSDTNKGGANVTASFEVPIGLDIYVVGTGWGAGPWGRGGWGSAYTGGGIGQQLRLWSNDNYGEQLFIAPRGGAIYYWIPEGETYPSLIAGGLATRAQSLATQSTAAGFDGTFVPNATFQIISSAIQRFIIAMGANPYDPTDSETTFDPMLVRWSDQENPYQWVPEVTNQAGEFRLSNGSYIMQARATRQEILVWTDSCLYSMQYLGPPYVWGFNVLMDNISVMSPNSMITINNVTYWMGTDKFYMYSGRVETLPCSLRQYIFDDINKDQAYQVFCGGNEGYNEVWWFYCSTNSNQVDKYVIYNYLDRVWYYGSMARSAWLDSGIRQYPMAADYNNRILYHESAVDDVSGLTPVPIDSYVQSSDFDIGDGHNFGFVWRILPDVNFNGSNVNNPQVTMTVKPRQNSGTPYGTADSPDVISGDNYGRAGVYNIQTFTGQVYTRLRGRQLAFRIESNTLGVSWQLGSPRIDIRDDGRR